MQTEVSPSARSVAERLATLGRQRGRAERKRSGAMDEIRDLIPTALEAGMSISEIARLAGVTRTTIYDLQERENNG